MSRTRYAISQWDVFTSKALSGNALVVFADARGLRDAQLQELARETNLSETAFVFPRDPDLERERGVRVRILTPERELPFAGHPTLGTAAALRAGGRPSPVALDLNVGRIEVRFDDDDPSFGEMHQPDPRLLGRCAAADVAAPLGIDLADIDTTLPIEIVSTGLPYLIVPLRTRDAASRVRVPWATALPFLASLPEHPSLYVVTRDVADARATLHARCLDPEREDAATGSAAGCAATWMVSHGVARPDERAIIEQGLEIGRPSTLFVRASRSGGRVTGVRVGGHAVEVMRGEYFVEDNE
jgi:trans-2,3-dihydro-3-hydroxyanthranilate isomerase